MLPVIINFIASVIYKIIGTSRAICIYTILIPVIKIKCSLHIKGTVTSVYYSSYYDVLLTSRIIIAYIKFITSATVTTYSFIFLWIWMKMPHILQLLKCYCTHIREDDLINLTACAIYLLAITISYDSTDCFQLYSGIDNIHSFMDEYILGDKLLSH